MKRRLKPLPKTRAEHPWRIRRESDDDVADREDPMLSLGARPAEAVAAMTKTNVRVQDGADLADRLSPNRP